MIQHTSILPPLRKFLPSRGGGEKKLFLIIVNVLGHPKGVGGLTSNFLCGGGMDVFWNEPNLVPRLFPLRASLGKDPGPGWSRVSQILGDNNWDL